MERFIELTVLEKTIIKFDHIPTLEELREQTRLNAGKQVIFQF